MPDREWYFYLNDMIQISENVLAYSNGFEQKSFAINRLIHAYLVPQHINFDLLVGVNSFAFFYNIFKLSE